MLASRVAVGKLSRLMNVLAPRGNNFLLTVKLQDVVRDLDVMFVNAVSCLHP
jgi:hypothetical protein